MSVKSDTVYVLNNDGTPLPPTQRGGHVRHLLKEGKATVVQTNPFTIRLTYSIEDPVYQRLILGTDPGRTNIGATVADEKGNVLFSATLETRNKDIPKLMKNREVFRRRHRDMARRDVRQRRAAKNGTVVEGGILKRRLPGCKKDITCHLIKNKKARFLNRTRPEGWLTPTANQLLDTHVNLVKKIQKILPITDIVLEVNKFAFMQLDNPNIKKWEYQKGPLYQKGSLHDAVSEQQAHLCIFCRKRGIDNFHHIVPLSKGGSDTIDNVVGLCIECHDEIHKNQSAWDKMLSIKSGLNKKYGALSVLNQIIPKLTDELTKMFPNHTFVTDGRSTKAFREAHGIPKDHHLDALCIAMSILDIDETKTIELPQKTYRLKQYRRHDRQACHQENVDRNYVNPKTKQVVAVNRRKRTEQKVDSLDDYRQYHSEKEISNLIVKKHKPVYKRMDRAMPGSLMLYQETRKDKNTGDIEIINKTVFILNGSSGTHDGIPDYYKDNYGNRYLASKCITLKNNEGIVFV